jgi:hypothetical protein
LKQATERERGYIAALAAFYRDSDKRDNQARATAYSQAMEKVYRQNPDDHEAAAFYALSLLASEPEGDTTFANRKQAAAVLEKLFAIEPDHPGVAHYLIHSYDKPHLAQLGFPRPAAMRRLRRLRRMRCTCHPTFLHALETGRMISPAIWPQLQPPAKPPPCTWVVKPTSSMPWIFWFTRICKAGAKPKPGR